jgi:hypothetical protein
VLERDIISLLAVSESKRCGMRLESVRDLKNSLPKMLEKRFSRVGRGGAAPFSLAAARGASFASTVPSYAFGVSRRRTTIDWRCGSTPQSHQEASS